MSDSISITVESRFEDVLHAAHVYDSRELFPVRRLLIDEAVALIAGAFLYYLYAAWWMWLACALLFPAFRLVVYAVRRPQMRAVWKSKIARGPFHVSFDSKGMVSQAGDARVELPWDHFEKLIESPRCFLLVYCSRGYATIPKHAFADETQMDEFRQLASSHIGNGE